MPRKPPPVIDELPFLVIEEGLKKNLSSERLRQFLVRKVSERAEIEIKYTKLLQGWTDDFNPFLNQEGGSEVYIDSEIIKKVLAAMKNEVIQLMATRQKIYNDVMSDEGAFNKLNEIRAYCQNGKNLPHIIQEFAVINDKKKECSYQHKKHIDRKSHFSNEINELERQMCQRSRLANKPRGSERGSKRIDEMQSRLSILRRQNDIEVDKIKILEKELSELGTSTKLPLESLDKQLQELEDRRIRAVMNNVKQYLNVLQSMHSPSVLSFASRGRPKTNELDGLDDLLKTHWIDVKTNAQRTKAGEKFKLRELFTVTHTKSKTDYGSESGLLSTKTADIDDFHEASKRKSKNPNFSPRSKDIELNLSCDSNGESPRESPSSELGTFRQAADGRRSRLNFTEEHFKDGGQAQRSSMDYEARIRSGPSKSNESIEELELPPEVWCPAEVTRQTPNRQFLVPKKPKNKPKPKKEIEATVPTAHATEYSQVSDYTGDDSDEDTELGKLRNVRVIAIRDNLVPAEGSELPFRKGQMIKQKVGINEDGFCYGWTRESPVGRKRYGYYRMKMVRRFDKTPEQKDETTF